MTESLHVIVIGGGIAGLCLAQGLRQAGVSVAVYERDRGPGDRLEDYRIHINPAGSRALHACLPPRTWTPSSSLPATRRDRLSHRTAQRARSDQR